MLAKASGFAEESPDDDGEGDADQSDEEHGPPAPAAEDRSGEEREARRIGEAAEQLAKLPPREALLSQVVSLVEAPIAELVGTLDGIIRELVGTLDALAKEKGEE